MNFLERKDILWRKENKPSFCWSCKSFGNSAVNNTNRDNRWFRTMRDIRYHRQWTCELREIENYQFQYPQITKTYHNYLDNGKWPNDEFVILHSYYGTTRYRNDLFTDQALYFFHSILELTSGSFISSYSLILFG